MAIAVRFVRPTIRHFSVRRPQPDSRTSRFVTSSCLFSAVVLPFVPPALESSRAKNTDGPNCSHTRRSVFMPVNVSSRLPSPKEESVIGT
ncbi:hypothetical protein BDV38DRAFT_284781 [Aspergillus pseudotamarii]|uniref:Uncharacterized protein n=1 Tax=Aspergillus pseudotamarii TaxID=132259 RepID=A0A5N6SLE5_ASPPS|nr:uncharacterized protein BDV38DRAFT_284781 [Aspergillus pseudotamarii]KAE8135516.1 hypothetical protein BDV38DRAFT_284781 [Aspergillus pseudotamarii]